MSYKIIIEDQPISKKRPRFSKRGNFVTTYSTQKDVEGFVRSQIIFQLRDQGIIRPLEGAISVEMAFYTSIPKSWSKKRSLEVVGEPDIRCTGDIDNYLKFYLDAMNGIAYDDDCQVWYSKCSKVYSNNPRTEIVLSQTSS